MKSIVTEFLDLIDRIGRSIDLPAVSDLILPPHTEQLSKDAEFCALVLADGSIGLTYVMLGDTLARLRDLIHHTGPGGLDAREVAHWYAEPDPARRAIGFAAINAVSQHVFARAGFIPDATTDSLALLEPGRDDHIGMVGLFPPLVSRVVAAGSRLTVAELRPQLAGDKDGYRVTLDIDDLRACNKIVSTSTVLLNDTLDGVLAVCGGASYLSVIGPGAGCLPDTLFARGVHTIGGTRVVDSAGFCTALTAGQPWGRFGEKYCIRREQYPGLTALLG